MASTDGAVKRIRYLMGRGPYRASPYSIRGGRGAIYSYGLCIAWRKDNGMWNVLDIKSSRTTNRHIRAAMEACTPR